MVPTASGGAERPGRVVGKADDRSGRPRTAAAQSQAEREVVQLCSELIRIDSVNTGDPATIGDGEARAARYLQAKLDEVGYETTYLEAVPGRGNVICRLAGADPTRGALLIHGHVDVVPADADRVDGRPVLRRGPATATSGGAAPST